MTVNYLEEAIRVVHSLSAAAWFGSLVYRTFCVDPKLKSFFGNGKTFEHASLHLAQGMRYVVLAALFICGLSGFALAGLRWNSNENWLTLMACKTGLWLLAFALFAYISWVFWPRRVFADSGDWPSVRRQGIVMSFVMIGLAGLGFVLGQLGQTVRLVS